MPLRKLPGSARVIVAWPQDAIDRIGAWSARHLLDEIGAAEIACDRSVVLDVDTPIDLLTRGCSRRLARA